MDIKYGVLTPNQARDFSNYYPSFLLKENDFDTFLFHVAVIDDSIAGMLVESGTIVEPEILSIGVKPSYENSGVATELLRYVLDEMKTRIPYQERIISNHANVRLTKTVGHEDKDEILRHLFEKEDFTVYNTGEYYSIPVALLESNNFLQNPKAIKKINDLRKEHILLSLDEVTTGKANYFANQMFEEGFLDEFDPSTLDKNISFFAGDGTSIDSAILFKKPINGVIYNALLYSQNPQMVGYLLTAATTAAIKNYSTDTEVVFWIGNEKTKKLITKIFPDASPDREVVDMECQLGYPKAYSIIMEKISARGDQQ